MDANTSTLRRVDPVTNTVTTIAGTPSAINAPNFTCPGTCCGGGNVQDGFGLQSGFGSPRYITTDNAGNLYITDTNGQSIRRYNTVTGYLDTLVGIGGNFGYIDGQGAAVQLHRPRGVASDGTSIFWAEQVRGTIRQAVIASTETSTLVGVNGCPGTQDGTGGDGAQCWDNTPTGASGGLCPGFASAPGCGAIDPTWAQLNTPFNVVFHYRTQSLFAAGSGRLVRIE